MMNILVTGGAGQLGKCVKELESLAPNYNFIYTDFKELDISKLDDVLEFYQNNKVDYCINCAAYTAVDEAENNQALANKINSIGAKNLAIACNNYNATLFHISTDFVFDGNHKEPYTESDQTNPINTYGKSKLNGELAIKEHIDKYFVIRTSWMYSKYGRNFMKTMIELSKSKDELSVVNDQYGTPTYAPDLASVILKLIDSKNENYGIYHYSNEGQTNWYEFAKAIFESAQIKIKLIPTTSGNFKTLAKRPAYSVLSKSKIKANLNIEISHWRDSLKQAIKEYYE